MKNFIFVSTLLVTGLALADVNDFNQLISENNQEAEVLQQKLAKEMGTLSVDTVRNKKNIAEIRRQMIQPEAEDIAVEDSSMDRISAPVNPNKQIEKQNIKRLSQELSTSEKY